MTQTTAGRAGSLIRFLRTALRPPDGGPTDGQLLGQFVADRDAEAFAELVRRHGPMVFGVCRRVLGHRQDAEDAFQAAFLVLARRAAAVAPPEAIGNWLYGVACRTALGARRQAARRRAKEREAAVDPRHDPRPDDPWGDVRPVLDEELAGLPDKYRQLVVLCDLEGRPRKAVARQLGLLEGTLSSRLATARRLLAGRLDRRGVTLSAAALAAVTQNAAPACVPARLVESTIRAALAAAGGVAGEVASAGAAALAETVIKGMAMGTVNKVVVGLLVVGLAGATWGWAYRTHAAGPGDDDPPAKAAAKAAKASAEEEITILQEKIERLREEAARKKAQAAQPSKPAPPASPAKPKTAKSPRPGAGDEDAEAKKQRIARLQAEIDSLTNELKPADRYEVLFKRVKESINRIHAEFDAREGKEAVEGLFKKILDKPGAGDSFGKWFTDPTEKRPAGPKPLPDPGRGKRVADPRGEPKPLPGPANANENADLRAEMDRLRKEMELLRRDMERQQQNPKKKPPVAD